MAEFNPTEILRILLRHQARFVVVGGIAGGLAGSPLTTRDLDLVYLNEEENNHRLASALQELEAIYKDPAGRTIIPDASRLGMYRVNLLKTKLGDLDLLREIGNQLGYQELLERSLEYDLEGARIRAINLETLIEAKELANRPKDHYALPFLRELLDLKRSNQA